VWVKKFDTEDGLPFSFGPEFREGLLDERNPNRLELSKFFEQIDSGMPFIHDKAQPEYVSSYLHNLVITKCFSCEEISIWVGDRVVFPFSRACDPPNSDLPTEIQEDHKEAQTIVNASPRGAAALLRLCVQKICVELGEKGNKIDDDIAALVAKGLDSKIQQALDVVRVVRNEAVHPGSMDIKDNTTTAMRLFELVNLIADQTITHPKNVKILYD